MAIAGQVQPPLLDSLIGGSYDEPAFVMRSRLSGFFALAVMTATVRGAAAYEFEIEATSIGQGYQLVWFRPSHEDVLLNRRRFTQSLRLHLWDILAPRRDPGYPDRPVIAPAEVFFTSSMRFDNDFGAFTQGDVVHGAETDPAQQLAPELQNYDRALDLLYAYVGARDVAGFVDLQVGRQMRVDTLDWYSFDGAWVRARTPWWLAIDAHGGLLVRSDIPGLLASPTHDPDGTSSRLCSVFDEDLGMWTDPYDFSQPPEECKQKKQVMPTFGVGLETEGLRAVKARLAYRRALSLTPTGMLPSDMEGNPPEWGVNDEKISLDARFNLFEGGLVPFGAARWNFLVAKVDEAEAGLRLDLGDHALTPEYTYSYPSWDGDSIFWVFTQYGYHDLRVTYDFAPDLAPYRLYLRGFARRFRNRDYADDPFKDFDGMPAPEVEKWSRGGGAGGVVRLGSGALRADGIYEDGYGGKRFGGDVSANLRLGRDLEGEGRLNVYRFEEDELARLKGTTLGGQAGVRWLMSEGIAFHLLVEENSNKFYAHQFRVFAILDLAFRPEL